MENVSGERTLAKKSTPRCSRQFDDEIARNTLVANIFYREKYFSNAREREEERERGRETHLRNISSRRVSATLSPRDGNNLHSGIQPRRVPGGFATKSSRCRRRDRSRIFLLRFFAFFFGGT